MMQTIARKALQQTARTTSMTTKVATLQQLQANDYTVAVIGAAGGIGQPLSTFLRLDKTVTDLRLFDVAPVTPGVAVDLSHISVPGKVTGYGASDLKQALTGADVVLIPAGVPRKPGMTRDDLFDMNAGIVANSIKEIALTCPDAMVAIISNPVNSTVPIAREVLQKLGKYNPKKLCGVTTLDCVRAEQFISEEFKSDPTELLYDVPVVGGHAGNTILPILSQVKNHTFSDEQKERLTHRIMFGGDEVVQAKAGGGSATLSMAFSAYRFYLSIVQGLEGTPSYGKVYAFVESPLGHADFFSSAVTLGKDGIETVEPIGAMDAFEQKKFDEMIPDLKAQIKKGIEWGAKFEV